MDSTQLPPPTLPNEPQANPPANPAVNSTATPAVNPVANTSVNPPANQSSYPPATSPVTQAVNPPVKPPVNPSQVNPQPLNPQLSASRPPETDNSEEPVFHSPIIEGLQQMQSEPFQSPVVPAKPVGEMNVESDQKSANDTPVESFSMTKEQPSAANIPPSKSTLSNGRDNGSGAKPPAKPPAKVEGSMFGKKWFLGLMVGIIVVAAGVFGWFFWQNLNSNTNNSNTDSPAGGQVTLTYWGLWEEDQIIEPLIAKYESLNPDIKINYEHMNHRQYRSRLQADIAQGKGPDIFRYHNTWLPMLQDNLATAPSGTITAQEIKDKFYPTVAKDVVRGNQTYGVPLMYDGLALVYNESMLETANALPPRDWKTLREVAANLTVRNEARLERGGIAMGTADNIDHFSDILGLLMLQNGASAADPTSAQVQTVLDFFTMFSRTDNDWDATMAQSTLAFANEQVAMIFVPSWRIHEIRNLNPNLRFGVTTVPQLSDTRITWSTYWVEGVSKKSRHSKEAWEFLTWLSQPEQLRQLYAEATKYRGFGEIYPRVEMANELQSDPDLAPYLQDALYAQSWYLAGATHDEGVNDQIIAYYKDAVNETNKNGRSAKALEAIAPGIKTVLSKFGIAVGR